VDRTFSGLNLSILLKTGRAMAQFCLYIGPPLNIGISTSKMHSDTFISDN
jgi:hypothetical protein